MSSWSQWRGANRDGIGGRLPATLPAAANFTWEADLPSDGIGGVASNGRYAIVGSRNFTDTADIFTCHDMQDGSEVWRVTYPALGKLDYGNSPRATPLFVGDKVVLQGAFGNLSVVNLEDGEVVWERGFQIDDGAELPIWGFCGSPLAVQKEVDGETKTLLVVQPGVEDAAILALDLEDGEVVWQVEGENPGYSSMIAADVGGTKQLIGYDARRICGWSLDGKELWTLTPEVDGDFNVPTPMMVGDLLFLTTENNGSRLYAFDEAGKIVAEPHAVFEDLAPDTHTPVIVGDLICGICNSLYCIKKDDLSLVSNLESDEYLVYSSIISDGKDRALVTTLESNLILLSIDENGASVSGKLKLSDQESMAHPAWVGGKLVLRIGQKLVCLELGQSDEAVAE